MTSFTAHEAGRILKLSAAELRACVKAAFSLCQPVQFSFPDLLVLKTCKGLRQANIPVARIRRILASLRRQLPEDQQLGSITIYADGRRVVVWDGAARWHPDSGQFLFDFEPLQLARELAIKAPRLANAVSPRPGRLTVDQWLAVAAEQEDECPEEACRAYREALTLDPACVTAHINLGVLHQQAQRAEEAKRCYQEALRHNPQESLAYFNLGVLYEEQVDADRAIESYKKALAVDSNYADAHYNLALLYEATGKKAEAIRHFHAIRRLTQNRRGRPSAGSRAASPKRAPILFPS
jgi:tetratricopeptide (TPR) repeat protein